MKHNEIAEDLDEWARIEVGHAVPRPIREWHFANGRYVVDGVPYSKPQIEAFMAGLEKGLEWVHAVAESIDREQVDRIEDEVMSDGE